MFDEVLKNEGSHRLARRASYLVWSTAVQAVAVLVLTSAITAMASLVPREAPPAIEVKFVKGAPRPAMPPPAPTRRKTAAARRPERPKPVAALLQPKEVPDRMAAPEPAVPPTPEAPAGGPGVIGGVVGGGEEAAAPSRPEFDAASMTRPIFVSGPDPAYTRAALDREVEGLMVVACVVTREGLVRDCRVQKSLPFMDAAVVQALERRRYRPSTLNGESIEVTYHFRLNLRLPR